MVADLWLLMLPSESSWKKQMGAIISFISMYYILINMMMIPGVLFCSYYLKRMLILFYRFSYWPLYLTENKNHKVSNNTCIYLFNCKMNNLFCQCTAVPVTGKLKQINGIIIELFATSHVLFFSHHANLSFHLSLPPSISSDFLHCYDIIHAIYVVIPSWFTLYSFTKEEEKRI